MGIKMAFWNRKRKKRKQERETEQTEEIMQDTSVEDKDTEEIPAGVATQEQYKTEVIKPVYKNDQKRYVTECCQSVVDADRQIEKCRKEYQNVTESLLDIQRIERIEGEDKKEVLDLAGQIVKLTRERNQYKNRNLTISEAAIRRLDPYEEELVDEIKKMYEQEAYQKALDGDLEKLHAEKKKIRKEKEDIVEKQHALKVMAKFLIALILSLFVLFVAIYFALETDMTFPYLATVLLAAISATVLFIESNKNRRDMTMADRKLDKAIGLLNRVKIKCVNNLNVMEYNHEKFGVKNASDFEKIWGEYCKEKEYEKKFVENTEQLNFYCEQLIKMLKKYEIRDREIWLSQVLAIIDPREMVEIRHGLNAQRQRLRERIEYNEEVKKEFIQSIDRLLQQNAENKEELLSIVQGYSLYDSAVKS